MKVHWTPIIYAAGLGTGWLVFGGGVRESAESAGNKSAAPVVTKREARPAKTPHETKFRNFAKELPKLSTEDKEAFKKSLAPKDRPAAIEAMLAQAGPDGIPGQTRVMVDEILKTWANEDFEGVWAWCQQLESDASRKFVASQIIEGLVNKDPDRAFALHLEMAAEDPEFTSHAPLNILQQAVSKDAASFLDLLGKLPCRNGSSGRPMDFAADFDFQQAADGITALTKSHSGKSPPAFPTNFLSSWAARDADAAYAWYANNNGTPFENFGNLLEGIEKQGVPGASAARAADKLSQPGTARDAMLRSLAQSTSDRKASTINSIAQAMPDTTSRDRFLGDMLTTSPYSDPMAEVGFTLNQMSTPAARLEALQQLRNNNRLYPAKISDTQLQQWGLTRQQVEQAAQK